MRPTGKRWRPVPTSVRWWRRLWKWWSRNGRTIDEKGPELENGVTDRCQYIWDLSSTYWYRQCYIPGERDLIISSRSPDFCVRRIPLPSFADKFDELTTALFPILSHNPYRKIWACGVTKSPTVCCYSLNYLLRSPYGLTSYSSVLNVALSCQFIAGDAMSTVVRKFGCWAGDTRAHQLYYPPRSGSGDPA